MPRTSLYKPEYAPMAKRFCLLKSGATDKDLATLFDVTETTINNWKNEHEEFRSAIHEGKIIVDANVANGLYERAVGYEHPAVKIFADLRTGDTLEVPYTEHYPPDVQAARLWLINRSVHWRDKQTIEIDDPKKELAKMLGVPEEDIP